MKVVNCWNEWDPLEEVIVGTAEHARLPQSDPSTIFFEGEESLGNRRRLKGPGRLYPPECVKKAAKQLDGLAELLEGEGCTVRRPDPPQPEKAVRTPYFEVDGPGSHCCPRDIFIPLGNQIIDTPMSHRFRYFEHLAYSPIFHDYMRRDPDFLFVSAPKPRLEDVLYNEEWYDMFVEKEDGDWGMKAIQRHYFPTRDGVEPVFDAADVMRFGKDLFMQRSVVSNDFGVEWFRRYARSQGFRVHEIKFEDDLPWHLDASFIPLRPGFCLVAGDGHRMTAESRKLFTDNEWELVEVPPPPTFASEFQLRQCSNWLGLNMFSISSKKVVVDYQQEGIIKVLEERGFDVVPVELNSITDFGGGIHCSTLDIRRTGECKDYFPDQSSAPEASTRWLSSK